MAEPEVPLDERTVDPDPLVQFGRWFEQAATVTANPEVMAVATADASGMPSVRMVLLKSWGAHGFVFYTNYDSRKGHELAANPHASLLFHWEALGRQVRIEGPVDRTSGEESDAYFATRPRGSQIGAHASHQSRDVEGRSLLDGRVEALQAQFAGQEVPRPQWWGGLQVAPRAFEFWQQRTDRMHDRIAYAPEDGLDGAWRITRLQP